jgi:hypothetical protein
MSVFARRKSTTTASYFGSSTVLTLSTLPLGSLGAEWDEFDFLCRLKAAGVTLGVGDLLGEPLQISSQGL